MGEALRVYVSDLPDEELVTIKRALETNGWVRFYSFVILHSGMKCPSPFPITLPDGRQFTLTPELLTIELKQLK